MSISGAAAKTTPYSLEEQKICDKLKRLTLLWELPHEELTKQLNSGNFVHSIEASATQNENRQKEQLNAMRAKSLSKSLSFVELSDDLAEPEETAIRNRNLP